MSSRHELPSLPNNTDPPHAWIREQSSLEPFLRSSSPNARPVSSSASNIISLYASTDGDRNSQLISSESNQSNELPYLRSSVSAQTSIDSQGADNRKNTTARPLPKIPSTPSRENNAGPPDLPARPSLPYTPDPGPSMPSDPSMDASRFYKPYDYDPNALRFYGSNRHASLGNTSETPSLEATSSAFSHRFPQTPPATASQSYSPYNKNMYERNLSESHLGSTKESDRAQSSQAHAVEELAIHLSHQSMVEHSGDPAAVNRSRSIVGKTLIGPGSFEKEAYPLPLPTPPVPDKGHHVSGTQQSDSFDALDPHARRSGSLLSPIPLTPDPSASYVGHESAYEDDSNLSMLSGVAILLRDAVPRGIQVKGSVSYPHSFTGRDVVSTLQALIPRETLAWAASHDDSLLDSVSERAIVLRIAKSLKSQLFFHEVDWGMGELQDGVEDVYMFLEDSLGNNHGGADDFDVELSKAARGSIVKKGLKTHANDIDDLPTGIFTPITPCYSPLCGRPGAPAGSKCFSPSCPRSRAGMSTGLSISSMLPEITSGGVVPGSSHNAVAWADTVPKSLLETLPKSEIKRQNAILELIQKEEEFLNDLELLDTFFLAGLLSPRSELGMNAPLLGEHDSDSFVREVFSNHRELTGHIHSLVERLHVRQREDGHVIQHIGDIYLNAALEWGGAFEVNMTSFPLAKYRLAREASKNPRVHDFLEQCRRDPKSHRLPMDHFLQRATTRLPRYNLHFKSILHDTDQNNVDCQSLSRAIELVDEQCKAIQKGVAAAEVKVKIREYAYNLVTKRNKIGIHMDLLNPERQLVHQGRVYRKPDFTDFEWQDLLCVLFDNYLVVTKTKKREEGTETISRFVLEKRPVAVEMIQMIGFHDAPVSRSIGLSNFHLRSDRENRDLYPFTIGHVGGKMEPLTLYVPSKAARDEWKSKIEEAVGLRVAMQEANKVFDTLPLSSDRFALPVSGSVDAEKAPAGMDPTDFHGMVTCVVPFQMRDGRCLIAVGCADGVWIGLRHDPKSLRKVLHVTQVTQVAVLEEFGIFVVLANRVLLSYSIDVLVPNANSPNNPRRGQKINERRDVSFFSVGKVKDRTLLVYMKRKPNESVFHALEPIAVHGTSEADRGGSSGGGGLFSKFSKDSKGSEWFRVYKTFFIPSEAYAMQFLRSKLCIVCARGFEILDLDSLFPGTIPDFSQSNREDARIYSLSRRVEMSRPLAMFKTQEGDFLLCYDTFACFVDRRGVPIRLEHIIEWEGTPHSIAFREPFVIAFDHRFIEVRDCASGQLVQLLRASDLRNVTYTSSTVVEVDEAIILVQRIPQQQRSGGRRTHDYQLIFELVANSPYSHAVSPFHSAVSNPSSPERAYHSPPSTLNRHGTSATTHTTTSNTSSQGANGGRLGWI